MKTILLTLNVLMVLFIIYLTTPILFEGVIEYNYSNETEHFKGKIQKFNNLYIYIYIKYQ